MEPFPFVVGRGRSGTTLVRAMFDSHPDMAIPDETHFILGLARKRRSYEQPEGFGVDQFLTDLALRPGFRNMGVSTEALRADLCARPPKTYPDAVRRVFALYAHERGKRRYGDKTPIHVLRLPALARLFPEGRFVHIVRDGRDVAMSYLDVPWGATSLEEAALLWKHAVQRGRRDGRRLGPARYREIRYEELVDDPERVLTELCEFLDMTFDPAMLSFHHRAHEVVGTMGVPEARQSMYLPVTKGIRDWRQQMAPSDVAQFEALAGGLLAELGYERAVLAPPIAVQFAAGRAWLRFQLARGRRSFGLRWARLRKGRRRPSASGRPPMTGRDAPSAGASG